MAAVVATFGSAPPEHFAAVTPDDNNDLPYVTRAILIGGAGDVYVDTLGGETDVPLKGLQAGMEYSGRFTRIRATNTTATNIVAMW